jgi:hypothetical protein
LPQENILKKYSGGIMFWRWGLADHLSSILSDRGPAQENNGTQVCFLPDNEGGIPDNDVVDDHLRG